MRTIWSSLLLLSLWCYSGVSSASSVTYWVVNTTKHASGTAACQSLTAAADFIQETTTVGRCMVGTSFLAQTNRVTDQCPNGHTGFTCNGTLPSCPHGPFDPVANACPAAPVNPCSSKLGQATAWTKEYANEAAYNANPVRCTASQGACAVDVCGDIGTLQCGTSGTTGKFGCWGKGTYSGAQQAPSDGSGVADCGANCKAPDPTSSVAGPRSCTVPQVNSGTTTYTCLTEANSDQFASANCAVGTVNGVTGLHCTKPDYVPEGKGTNTTENIKEVPNASGGKTTTNESTVTKTSCKAGVCTTTTTTTTTTTNTDSAGETTDETKECKGDKCDGIDEEAEEEGERTVGGESCSSTLTCEGDAIDCAILRQQKEMTCSLDWATQKGAVLAEAGKSEYQLQTEDIDAATLFSGPSAGRWLSPSCPADRQLHLATTGTTITLSWSYVCQYAIALGNLLVGLASLFFAVYVGRAFGGD